MLLLTKTQINDIGERYFYWYLKNSFSEVFKKSLEKYPCCISLKNFTSTITNIYVRSIQSFKRVQLNGN